MAGVEAVGLAVVDVGGAVEDVAIADGVVDVGGAVVVVTDVGGLVVVGDAVPELQPVIMKAQTRRTARGIISFFILTPSIKFVIYSPDFSSRETIWLGSIEESYPIVKEMLYMIYLQIPYYRNQITNKC